MAGLPPVCVGPRTERERERERECVCVCVLYIYSPQLSSSLPSSQSSTPLHSSNEDEVHVPSSHKYPNLHEAVTKQLPGEERERGEKKGSYCNLPRHYHQSNVQSHHICQRRRRCILRCHTDSQSYTGLEGERERKRERERLCKRATDAYKLPAAGLSAQSSLTYL